MPWPALAHALPESIGAVPLTVVLTGVIALFLGANALAVRRASRGGITAGDRAAEAARPAAAGSDEAPGGRGLTAGRAVGLAGLVAVAVLASAGPSDAAANLTDYATLTLLWAVVALSSALVGWWWPRIDPLRGAAALLAAAVGDPGHTGARPLPRSTADGLLLASLLAWAWTQLLMPQSNALFQAALLVHVVVHLAGAARYGPRWLADVEPLSAVSRAMGLLAPGGGGPVRRLAALAAERWHTWTASALIAWSLTDLVIETEAWHALDLDVAGRRAAGTALLLATTAALIGLARAADGRLGIGPALLPVALGWVAAQYLSQLLIEAQGVPIWLSDPLGTGADLLGRRGDLIDLEPIPTDAIAALQLLPFVGGHLVAVLVLVRRAAVRAAGSRTAAHPTAAQLGGATFLPRALVAALLVGGTWLQLGGL